MASMARFRFCLLLAFGAIVWTSIVDAQTRRSSSARDQEQTESSREPQPPVRISRQVRTYVDGALVEEGEVQPLRPLESREPVLSPQAESGRHIVSDTAEPAPALALPDPDPGPTTAGPLTAAEVPEGDHALGSSYEAYEIIGLHPFIRPGMETEAAEDAKPEQVEAVEAVPLWQRSSAPSRTAGGLRGRRPLAQRGGASEDGNYMQDESQVDPLLSAPATLLPSPNLVIGEIISVDPSHGTAVLWLKTRHIFVDQPVISRGLDLQPSATLAPAQQRLGRAQGMVISEGMPRQGDEVVLVISSME